MPVPTLLTYSKLVGGGEIHKYEAQSRNLIENSDLYCFSLVEWLSSGFLLHFLSTLHSALHSVYFPAETKM